MKEGSLGIVSKFRLTHYSQVLHLYTPWKHQKTFRFSGGIEKQHWAVMG